MKASAPRLDGDMTVKSSTTAGEPDKTADVTEVIQALEAEARQLRGELARLEEALRQAEALADRDPLLPVLNRRAFLREMAREMAFMRRYQERAGLIYFDIDNFKQINDTHGHQAGDMVLEYLAHLITEHVRETDIVARLGGDEFAILLVRADEVTTRDKAEALARIVAEEPLVIAGQAMALSISTGAIGISGEDDAETALARADQAMYASKRARK